MAGLVAVGAVLLLALLSPLVVRLAGARAGRLLAVLPAALCLYFASISPAEPAAWSREWAPGLGVSLSIYMDGLGVLFALLICGIGALVLVYADGYLAGDPRLGRFYALLLLFMASMLGVVLAGNLLTLFVFWELTSLTSFFLIGFDHEREESRRAALQALLVTGGGGLALLAGLVLLGQAAGSYEIADVLARGDQVRAHSLYEAALVLVVIGAFTKSAQAPFHFWLPNAMAAPTPVSAYLHSATMVKAGVFLLARLSPALGGGDAWLYALSIGGAVTMLVGAHQALAQTDMKRMLAYSTVAALGMLTMLLGIGTPLAVKAAMVLLVAHALYKGALFLVAGAVDHETGTRDLSRLGGLRRAMPLTALAGGLAALSMAGVAPLFGFISKEALYDATSEWGAWALAASVVAGVLLVAAAGALGLGPFLGAPRAHLARAHEGSWALWAPPLLLAALGVLLGLAPSLVDDSYLAPAATAVLSEPATVSLTLWHGFNTVLILSALTLAAGVAVYAVLPAYRRAANAWPLWPGGGDRVYDLGLEGLMRVAAAQTRLLQSGYLRVYLLTIVGVVTASAGVALLASGALEAARPANGVRFYEATVAAAIVAGTLAAVFTDSRFAAVAALGVVGYATGLIYLFFGAPDLAMTQILVDTLVVILFAFVFYHLPRFSLLSRPASRLRDAAFCVAAGLLMTGLVLAASGVEPDKTTSRFYLEASRPEGKGDNVVNVILVDFRALDTLGEITVLAAAGIGVLALLRLRVQVREDAP